MFFFLICPRKSSENWEEIWATGSSIVKTYLPKHLAYFRGGYKITLCSKHIPINVETSLRIRQNFLHVLSNRNWPTKRSKILGSSWEVENGEEEGVLSRLRHVEAVWVPQSRTCGSLVTSPHLRAVRSGVVFFVVFLCLVTWRRS